MPSALRYACLAKAPGCAVVRHDMLCPSCDFRVIPAHHSQIRSSLTMRVSLDALSADHKQCEGRPGRRTDVHMAGQPMHTVYGGALPLHRARSRGHCSMCGVSVRHLRVACSQSSRRHLLMGRSPCLYEYLRLVLMQRQMGQSGSLLMFTRHWMCFIALMRMEGVGFHPHLQGGLLCQSPRSQGCGGCGGCRGCGCCAC